MSIYKQAHLCVKDNLLPRQLNNKYLQAKAPIEHTMQKYSNITDI